jgi:hypothetical protein
MLRVVALRTDGGDVTTDPGRFCRVETSGLVLGKLLQHRADSFVTDFKPSSVSSHSPGRWESQ